MGRPKVLVIKMDGCEFSAWPISDEIDLDNLQIRIRKHTAKYHRRAKIWVYTKGYARIEITDMEQCYGCIGMACILNHEFLHWIITLLTHTKPKKYDQYLDSCGLYDHECLMREML